MKLCMDSNFKLSDSLVKEFELLITREGETLLKAQALELYSKPLPQMSICFKESIWGREIDLKEEVPKV